MSELPHLGRASLNLITLVLAGLSGSWWVLYFTDYFPVVLGLIGLGGFFAWVAFLINILSDDRKTQLQNRFDEAVLQKNWLIVTLIGSVMLGWLGLGAKYGTVIVDSIGISEGHVVEVFEFNGKSPKFVGPVKRVALAGSAQAKVLLPTGWMGSKDYYIKVSGLPGKRVSVSSLKRAYLLIPEMFVERPVILIRPTANQVGPVSDGYAMQIHVNGRLLNTLKEYKGQLLWLGAEDDVKIPETLIGEWEQEFVRSKLDVSGLRVWKRPISMIPFLELPAGATVTVSLFSRSELDKARPKVKYSGQITLAESGKARAFPEELIFYELKPGG